MTKRVRLKRNISQGSRFSSIHSTASQRRGNTSSPYKVPKTIVLYEELRLIERGEAEINGVWRGAHILLFFLVFIFGSFCTFCFHMLMFMFDDKCVLFPKLLSIKSQRHSKIYEIMPIRDKNDTMQVDFVNAQWMDPSVCYLPAYVPLVSGIFGLVWITMFLMCSTGTRTHTGLQSPWRVLIPVFLFSLAMSILCVHASTVTENGLQAFCDTLAEITSGYPCSYAVNVVSLAYHRRIRGVYQATRLTVISAWFHTTCWLCSVALVVVRVVLAVDFQLVRVRAELIGDADLMLQRHEKHIRTVSPESEVPTANVTTQYSAPATELAYTDQHDANNNIPTEGPIETTELDNNKSRTQSDQHSISQVVQAPHTSSESKNKLIMVKPFLTLPRTAILSNDFISAADTAAPENATAAVIDQRESANQGEMKDKITPLFINSPSSSEYEDSLIKLKIKDSQQQLQSQANKNEAWASSETNKDECDGAQSLSKAKAESTIDTKNVNISKYILTHRPSLDITQLKEIANMERSSKSVLTRRDKKLSSRSLSSSDIVAHRTIIDRPTEHQSPQKDKEEIRAKRKDESSDNKEIHSKSRREKKKNESGSQDLRLKNYDGTLLEKPSANRLLSGNDKAGKPSPLEQPPRSQSPRRFKKDEVMRAIKEAPYSQTSEERFFTPDNNDETRSFKDYLSGSQSPRRRKDDDEVTTSKKAAD